MAGVRHSRHNGAAAAYAMMAASQDLIGFASTGVIPLMAPPGGLLPTHGNNPLCFAMPSGSEPMFVHDMATSEKAWGNVLNYRREGKRMPLGWALDGEGNPTEDPDAAASLVAIGDRGIKGFGLAVALDILCGVMTGANFARRFDPDRLDEDVGHFFFAMDPGLFMPIEEFKERIDETLREIRNAPRRAGVERIYISGEIEALARARALREGISLPPVLVQQLRELGDQLGVESGI
jgi:LDH2 family malate/lactate/ureidoglycolate dehydrogenase